MARIGWLAIAASVSLIGSAVPVLAAEEQQDEAGRVVESVEEDGTVVRYRYDEVGRVVDAQRSEESSADTQEIAEPGEE